ncbi:hypothetical protein Tco_1243301 [Tanacetum coccineum]
MELENSQNNALAKLPMLKLAESTARDKRTTSMETSKPLMKDENAKDVDVHLYRSMTGSLIDLLVASLDKKSTIGGCQFLGSRLILWQWKKQTVVANSTTEAEYMVTVSCYGQVL